MPLLGSHFMILLGGMSEKTRKPLSLIQQQPSAQSKPSPRTSIVAPCETSLSKAGSSRSMEPIDLVLVCARVDETVIERMAIVASRNLLDMGLLHEGISGVRRNCTE